MPDTRGAGFPLTLLTAAAILFVLSAVHPYEIGTESVLRYFEMMRDCAEAQRLSMN